jgi:hypothetical protein
VDVIPAAVRRIPLLAVLLTAACSIPAEPTRSAGPLAHTFESPDALARTILVALAGRDVDRLRQLALTEDEFREHVWPELPTSRPERNVPFDYAWGQLKQHSDSSLSETVGRYGGRPLRFVRTAFSGESTTYQTFTVIRESEIIAADESGRELVLRLYGSALVKDGRYKLYSFVVD